MIAGGYSAVVFDLDGTLADTAADVQQSLARALATEGLPPIDVAATRLMIGGGPRKLVERALHRLGMPTRETLAERLTHTFHAEYLEQENKLSRLFEGVESSLRQMHAAGTRLGLCSNKPDDLCRLLVRDFGLGTVFDEVLGSGAGLPRKPDPASTLVTAKPMS
jgi:phosphoglycolate phosphatase